MHDVSGQSKNQEVAFGQVRPLLAALMKAGFLYVSSTKY